MTGKVRRQLPHFKLAFMSQRQWDAFFCTSRQVRPMGVTRYRTSRIMCSRIPGPRGLQTSRGIQALVSNLSLRILRSRKLPVGCRVFGATVHYPLRCSFHPCDPASLRECELFACLGGTNTKRERNSLYLPPRETVEEDEG